MDENLEELYDNLADLDDEEYYDSEDDEVEDEEYDEEDNIAEDPGDDENWWENNIDDNAITEQREDEDLEQYSYKPDEIEQAITAPIGHATTGDELVSSIADTLQNAYDLLTFYGSKCEILFVSTSEFEALPDEEKHPSSAPDGDYDDVPSDEESDTDNMDGVGQFFGSNKIYFIYDYEGEQ